MSAIVDVLSGRHRGDERTRRRVLVAVGVVIVDLLLLMVWAVAAEPWSSATVADVAAMPCPSPVTVSISAADTDAMKALAAGYVAHRGLSCDPLRLIVQTSSKALESAGAGSGAFIRITHSAVEDTALMASQVTPFASTPVMLAMPTPLARALGWPDRQLDPVLWADLMAGRVSWSTLGHPDWGPFTIRSPDPRASAEGLIGYAALIGTSNSAVVSEPPSFTHPTTTDRSIIAVGHHITSLGDDPVTALPHAATLAQATRVASAFVTTERDLQAYDAIRPAVPMSAFYLAAGAASIPINLATVGTATGGAYLTIQDLSCFLESVWGTSVVRSAGLRSTTGDAPTTSDVALHPDDALLTPMLVTPEELAAAEQIWTGTQVSTLALVDVSTAAGSRFGDATTTAIDAVRQASAAAYAVASPQACSGVWFFHTDGSGRPLVEQRVTLADNGSRSGRHTHAFAAVSATRTVGTGGGRPLSEAIESAYGYAAEHYQPGRANQLLVVTTGADEGTTSEVDQAEIDAYVRATFSATHPVAIVVVGLGDVDLGPFQTITSLTGGRTVHATTPAQVRAAFALEAFRP